mmetsp:Transcript_12050/g.39433  ORF Transcript_12050/g.39433 Transcript_12050/m.39433 type:complete len:251 (-) Transcript_12050:652-1404(-)
MRSRRYWGMGSPASSRSWIFAWAMSRATTIVPVSESRVATGYRESCARMSSMGRSRSTATTASLRPPSPSTDASGRNRAGSRSSASRKTPSRVTLPRTCRSAEQDTPSPTGHDAPWRGSRTTRTSWQKYLPPNCAPTPRSRVSWSTLASQASSRNARPFASPDRGRPSKYFVDASLTVLSVISADRPPTTSARWYGGHAAVPRPLIFSSTKASRDASFSSALVCWKRKVLFADPPPLATKRKWYSSPSAA